MILFICENYNNKHNFANYNGFLLETKKSEQYLSKQVCSEIEF